MRQLEHQSIYWIGISAEIENHITNCTIYLIFQQMHVEERLIHHEATGRP